MRNEVGQKPKEIKRIILSNVHLTIVFENLSLQQFFCFVKLLNYGGNVSKMKRIIFLGQNIKKTVYCYDGRGGNPVYNEFIFMLNKGGGLH